MFTTESMRIPIEIGTGKLYLWHSVAGEEWFRSRTSAQHLLRWLGDQEQDSWQEIKTPFEGGDRQVENGENRIILEMD